MKPYIQVTDGKVVGRPEMRDIKDWSEVALNHDGSLLLREYVDVPPSFDAATHKIERSGYDISDTTVVVAYNVVPLTKAELALNTFNAQIAAGYDTGKGFRLLLNPSDVAILTSMYAALDLALKLGAKTESDIENLTDINGVDHPLTIGEILPILLGYSFTYGSIRAQYRAAIAPPASVASIEPAL